MRQSSAITITVMKDCHSQRWLCHVMLETQEVVRSIALLGHTATTPVKWVAAPQRLESNEER